MCSVPGLIRLFRLLELLPTVDTYCHLHAVQPVKKRHLPASAMSTRPVICLPFLLHPPAQITHCSDKYSPEEIVRLVNGLELAPNGLIEYKSKVNLFVSK